MSYSCEGFVMRLQAADKFTVEEEEEEEEEDAAKGFDIQEEK